MSSPYALISLRNSVQKRCFGSRRSGAQFRLYIIVYSNPVTRIDQLPLELLQLLLVRSDEIATLGSLQPVNIRGAAHAAIHHPDPPGFAIATPHRLYDIFNRRDVNSSPAA